MLIVVCSQKRRILFVSHRLIHPYSLVGHHSLTFSPQHPNILFIIPEQLILQTPKSPSSSWTRIQNYRQVQKDNKFYYSSTTTPLSKTFDSILFKSKLSTLSFRQKWMAGRHWFPRNPASFTMEIYAFPMRP